MATSSGEVPKRWFDVFSLAIRLPPRFSFLTNFLPPRGFWFDGIFFQFGFEMLRIFRDLSGTMWANFCDPPAASSTLTEFFGYLVATLGLIWFLAIYVGTTRSRVPRQFVHDAMSGTRVYVMKFRSRLTCLFKNWDWVMYRYKLRAWGKRDTILGQYCGGRQLSR